MGVTSFSTGSSLTTALPSSQLSIRSTKSQRLLQDGQELVTNSSSEVEELADNDKDGLLDDDSDDELNDIEVLIARKRQELAIDREEKDLSRSITPQSGHNLRDHSAKKAQKTKSPAYPTPPQTTFKNNLADIVKQQRKQKASEDRLKALEEQDNRADERFAAFQALDGDGEDMGEKAAEMLQDEDDDGFRLKIALKRMDALEQEVKFYFFDTVPADDPTRLPFPDIEADWQPWVNILKGRCSTSLGPDLTDARQTPSLALPALWQTRARSIPYPPSCKSGTLVRVRVTLSLSLPVADQTQYSSRSARTLQKHTSTFLWHVATTSNTAASWTYPFFETQ